MLAVIAAVSTAISRCHTRPKPSPAAAPPHHDTATWSQTRVLLSNISSRERKTEKNSCLFAYNVKCCLLYEWIPLLNSNKWSVYTLTEQSTRGTIVPFLQCHKTSSHLISPHQLCRANMQTHNQIYNLVSCCNHLRLWRTNGPNLAA